MTVLILGGNGYIGSKITRALLLEGCNVVCTLRPKSDLQRLEDIKDKITFIPATGNGVEAEFRNTSFDYVLNFAGNYGRSQFLYSDVINANIKFPLTVLNTAAKYGTKKFLTVSTGLPSDFNVYSFSKNVFSDFGRFYWENHDMTFNSVLLQMFYGPDEPKDRFLPSIVDKMIKGKPVDTTVGTQHRDIICYKDVVDAIMTVFHSDLNGYNEIPVGTGIAPSISEIVDYIWEETGKKSAVKKGMVPMRSNEPDCIADTTFLKTLCDWKPIFWKDGLKQMIDTMKSENT